MVNVEFLKQFGEEAKKSKNVYYIQEQCREDADYLGALMASNAIAQTAIDAFLFDLANGGLDHKEAASVEKMLYIDRWRTDRVRMVSGVFKGTPDDVKRYGIANLLVADAVALFPKTAQRHELIEHCGPQALYDCSETSDLVLSTLLRAVNCGRQSAIDGNILENKHKAGATALGIPWEKGQLPGGKKWFDIVFPSLDAAEIATEISGGNATGSGKSDKNGAWANEAKLTQSLFPNLSYVLVYGLGLQQRPSDLKFAQRLMTRTFKDNQLVEFLFYVAQVLGLNLSEKKIRKVLLKEDLL